MALVADCYAEGILTNVKYPSADRTRYAMKRLTLLKAKMLKATPHA